MGLANSKPQAIDIPPVQVHDIETSPEKRTRSLKHLIRANHVNHSIAFRRLDNNNDLPHVSEPPLSCLGPTRIVPLTCTEKWEW